MLAAVLIVTFVVLLVVQYYLHVSKHRRKYADIPAVGHRWPLIGNIFDMSKTHLILTEWYRKYGPVFRFNLYGEEIVVLNDFDSVYEALVTRGSDLAGRPQMPRTDYQDRNKNSIVWQTYTPKLQFLRKQIHSSLRMYGGGIDRLMDRCNVEIDQLISRINNCPDMTFDPWEVLYDSSCNIMLDLTLGFRLAYDGKDLARLKRINGLFNHTFGPGVSRILDGFPVMNYFREEYRALKAAVDLRNDFWIEHGQQDTDNGCSSQCVIRDLNKLALDSRYAEFDVSESTTKEAFTNLILAGTDTTTTSLTCFLLVLLHYPDVQQKIHDEIDRVVGKTRAPLLSDRVSMPYTEACLMETLRFISHVPLAVPHATVCDTTVCGKQIPRNTTVYMNLWSVHHDETFWHEPWQFNPARFLDDRGNLVPASHQCRRRLLVFGAGRRVCLGETLAKNRLFLFAVALLQSFHFRQHGEHLPDLDPRSFKLGLVLHPEKFKIHAVRRATTTIMPNTEYVDNKQS